MEELRVCPGCGLIRSGKARVADACPACGWRPDTPSKAALALAFSSLAQSPGCLLWYSSRLGCGEGFALDRASEERLLVTAAELAAGSSVPRDPPAALGVSVRSRSGREVAAPKPKAAGTDSSSRAKVPDSVPEPAAAGPKGASAAAGGVAAALRSFFGRLFGFSGR